MVEVVPEAKSRLEDAHAVAGDKLILHYLEDVKSQLYACRLDGQMIKKLEMPLGAVRDVFAKRKYNHFLFSLSSFNIPGVIYEVDMEGGTFDLKVIRRITVCL